MTLSPKHIWQTKKQKLLLILVLTAGLTIANRSLIVSLLYDAPFFWRFFPHRSIVYQIEQYGEGARQRLRKMFGDVGVEYPPDRIAFVAIKDERLLELYAASDDGHFKLVHAYPILAASGHLGPKLREGDRQVPEGIYHIQSLEPNTPYHLGLRVNYPNEFDLAHARDDGRTNPGSDILIHGSNGSVGCLAMGDEASEDLFVVANDAKDAKEHKIPLIIAPVDLRTTKAPPAQEDEPKWVPELYADIRQALSAYPAVEANAGEQGINKGTK